MIYTIREIFMANTREIFMANTREIFMANTFTKLYIHVVLSVQSRHNLISNNWKEELYKYITGIIKLKNKN